MKEEQELKKWCIELVAEKSTILNGQLIVKSAQEIYDWLTGSTNSK